MRSFHPHLLAPLTAATLVAAVNPTIKLESFPNMLNLTAAFDPIKEAYWTDLPHHRRTPFAVSPDGQTSYIAYLDASGTDVHVQHFHPPSMTAKGPDVTLPGLKEAGGIVAHNHGFALLGNEAIPSSVSNTPPGETPNGKQVWRTFVAGPGVHESDGLSMAPDMNGDSVRSEAAQMYGAYFVVTAYSGWAAEGRFGDSIQYVNDAGELQTIAGASSAWGCSRNTGIAFEATDEPPFASICAEEQGAIWLNTKTQGMGSEGVKISNEKTTNGGSGEPMGGMSGSYSSLVHFDNSSAYIFAWVSRGASELSANDWMGDGYTHALNRTNGRRVAIATLSDKQTLVSAQASSTLGGDGDSQITWLTPDIGPDRSNAHIAVFDDYYALVSWEEIASPECEFVAMGCGEVFTGTYYQLVDKEGKSVGEPTKSMETYVAGDMVSMSGGRICWPYVEMEWSLSQPSRYARVEGQTTAQSMSFACVSLDM